MFRNETGCNAGFTKIASGTSATSLADANVANGLTYFYQVTAFPSGNEACASLALDLHLGHPDRHHDP